MSKYCTISSVWIILTRRIHREYNHIRDHQGLVLGLGIESHCFLGMGFPLGVMEKIGKQNMVMVAPRDECN